MFKDTDASSDDPFDNLKRAAEATAADDDPNTLWAEYRAHQEQAESKGKSSPAQQKLVDQARARYEESTLNYGRRAKADPRGESLFEEYKPLDRRNPPALPLEALPSVVAEFSLAVARETRTPVDVAAMSALSAHASALARKVKVNLNGGSWWQPLNLYLATAMDPGEGKTGAFNLAVEPIRDFDQAERLRLAKEIAEHNARLEMRAARVAKLKEIAAKGKTHEEREAAEKDAVEMERELAGQKPRFAPCLAIKSDVNEEGCRNLLAEQGGRLSILDSEGGALFDRMARYGQKGSGANVEVYLNTFDGDTVESTRAGKRIVAPRAVLTIGLAIQRTVLEQVAQASRGRGLLERFLFALPEPVPLEKFERNPPNVPDEVASRYREHLLRLLRLPARTDGADESHRLFLSAGAAELLNDFVHEMKAARGRRGKLSATPNLKGFAGKLPAQVGRLAAILHLCDHACESEPWTVPVSEDAMRRALALGRYFIEHVLVATDVLDDDEATANARKILNWVAQDPEARCRIETKKLSSGPGGFRGKVKVRNEALEVLEAHGIAHVVLNRRGQPCEVVFNLEAFELQSGCNRRGSVAGGVQPRERPQNTTSEPTEGTFDSPGCTVAGGQRDGVEDEGEASP
jgi:hypothetical protein